MVSFIYRLQSIWQEAGRRCFFIRPRKKLKHRVARSPREGKTISRNLNYLICSPSKWTALLPVQITRAPESRTSTHPHPSENCEGFFKNLNFIHEKLNKHRTQEYSSKQGNDGDLKPIQIWSSVVLRRGSTPWVNLQKHRSSFMRRGREILVHNLASVSISLLRWRSLLSRGKTGL